MSAGVSGSVPSVRANRAIATGVRMLNTAFWAGGCRPSGVTLTIQPCEQVRRRYSLIPRKPRR